MIDRSRFCYRHPEQELVPRSPCLICWREMKTLGIARGAQPSRVYDSIDEAIAAVKSRPYDVLVVGIAGEKWRVYKDGRSELVLPAQAGRPGLPVGARRTPLLERLISRREIDPVTGCWIWRGAINRGGYGRIANMDSSPRSAFVHRVSYELFVGPISEGLHIDHLCRVRACFNPDHLEAVTPRENTARSSNFIADNIKKTHCLRGHEFTPENTYISTTGRCCRSCSRDVYHKRKYGKDKIGE